MSLLYIIYSIGINPKAYSNQILSILTVCCITNLAFNPKCVNKLEHPWLNFIGKISFGLYLMHKFPVEFIIGMTNKLEIKSVLFQNIFIYGLSIPLSILLAYVSFHYFESWFLKLKDKKFAQQ